MSNVNGLGQAAGAMGQLAGALDPLGSAIGGVLKAIGLPSELVNVAKIAGGIATGNVMMAASGGMGLVADLAKNPPAQTEYKPSKDAAKCGAGYAPKPQRDVSQGGESRSTHQATSSGRSIGAQGSSGAARNAHAAGSHGVKVRDPSADSKLRQLETERRHLQEIDRNLAIIDTAGGWPFKDGLISRQDLAAILRDPRASSEVKDAARFLLEAGRFTRLDTAAHIGGTDGLIGRADLRTAIGSLDSKIAELKRNQRSEQPAPTPAPPPSPSAPRPSQPSPSQPSHHPPSPPAPTAPRGSNVNSIINDPSLSMEEKVQMILMDITESMDEQILGVMRELDQENLRRAGLTTDDKEGLAKADSSIQHLTMRLQKLVERQKAMFDLMSNMSAKFNEMASRAIDNLGRA